MVGRYLFIYFISEAGSPYIAQTGLGLTSPPDTQPPW